MAEGDQRGQSEPSLGMKVVLSTVRQRFRNVRQLSTETLAKWLEDPRGDKSGKGSEAVKAEDKLILLDTRPEEEYVVSHLPKAVRVDPDLRDMSSLLHTLPDWFLPDTELHSSKSVTIVCYCSLGYRSSSLVQRLQKYLQTTENSKWPLAEVFNLEGSLFKWANEGRPMVDGNNEPTVYAHPFSTLWGRLLSEHLRRDKPSESMGDRG